MCVYIYIYLHMYIYIYICIYIYTYYFFPKEEVVLESKLKTLYKHPFLFIHLNPWASIFHPKIMPFRRRIEPRPEYRSEVKDFCCVNRVLDVQKTYWD